MKFLFSGTGFIAFVFFSFCSDHKHKLPSAAKVQIANAAISSKKNVKDPDIRTVHVFVALCDNKYQGIVPVGKTIGNGQDADNNLYWGCDYGVRTYFKKKNSDWVLVESRKKPGSFILEQLLFKHKTRKVYLLAEAYDGQYIEETTIDFLQAASRIDEIRKIYKDDTLCFGGASDLIAYIGHDGLMDFSLPLQDKSADTSKRETIILACYSKNFFSQHLRQTNAQPLAWTTGLMAPEAYTLHDALHVWVNGGTGYEVREAAAAAYSKYQKCSKNAAKNLLVTGW
jgi:hypothetical protein